MNSSNVNGMCYNVDEHLITEYEDTFTGLACLSGKYEIKVDGNVTPVQHAPRRVPISLKNELKVQLESLKASNVITPVKEPTKWIFFTGVITST